MRTKLFAIVAALFIAGCGQTVKGPTKQPAGSPEPAGGAKVALDCSKPLNAASIPAQPLAGTLKSKDGTFPFAIVQGSSRIEINQANITFYNKQRDGKCSRTPTNDFGQLVDTYFTAATITPGTHTYTSEDKGPFSQIDYSYLDADLTTNANAVISNAVYVIEKVDDRVVRGKAAICWQDGSSVAGTFEADRCAE